MPLGRGCDKTLLMAVARALAGAAAIFLTIWLALPAGATEGHSLCGVER